VAGTRCLLPSWIALAGLKFAQRIPSAFAQVYECCVMGNSRSPLDASGLFKYTLHCEGSVDSQFLCGRLGWLELIAKPSSLDSKK
jgi:hypothetical protein